MSFQNDQLKTNAALYMIQISEILNRVPRQLLLIMKTNDVLRGIEASLQTRANASSFLNMSRSCVRAVSSDEMRQCDNFLQAFKIRLATQWQLCKLGFYEFYLWLQSSVLVKYFSSRQNATGQRDRKPLPLPSSQAVTS